MKVAATGALVMSKWQELNAMRGISPLVVL